MFSRSRSGQRSHKIIPVPVMLQMLELLESETNGDAVLAGVSRTLSQAIDELVAIQRTAFDVAREADALADIEDQRPVSPRRLC